MKKLVVVSPEYGLFMGLLPGGLLSFWNSGAPLQNQYEVPVFSSEKIVDAVIGPCMKDWPKFKMEKLRFETIEIEKDVFFADPDDLASAGVEYGAKLVLTRARETRQTFH